MLVACALQAAASSAVESLIDMQGCLVVIISNSRWVGKSFDTVIGQQNPSRPPHPLHV